MAEVLLGKDVVVVMLFPPERKRMCEPEIAALIPVALRAAFLDGSREQYLEIQCKKEKYESELHPLLELAGIWCTTLHGEDNGPITRPEAFARGTN